MFLDETLSAPDVDCWKFTCIINELYGVELFSKANSAFS